MEVWPIRKSSYALDDVLSIDDGQMRVMSLNGRWVNIGCQFDSLWACIVKWSQHTAYYTLMADLISVG